MTNIQAYASMIHLIITKTKNMSPVPTIFRTGTPELPATDARLPVDPVRALSRIAELRRAHQNAGMPLTGADWVDPNAYSPEPQKLDGHDSSPDDNQV